MAYDDLIFEAHTLAFMALRESDRKFWLNIATCWTNLRDLPANGQQQYLEKGRKAFSQQLGRILNK